MVGLFGGPAGAAGAIWPGRRGSAPAHQSSGSIYLAPLRGVASEIQRNPEKGLRSKLNLIAEHVKRIVYVERARPNLERSTNCRANATEARLGRR